MAIDNNVADGYANAYMELVEANTGTTFASKTIVRTDFAAANSAQSYQLCGKVISGGAFAPVVLMRYLFAGGAQLTWSASRMLTCSSFGFIRGYLPSSAFTHTIGQVWTQQSWIATVAHGMGWMAYGPYETLPLSASMRATWTLMIDNNVADANVAVQIDVVYGGGATTANSLQIKRTDFTAAGTAQRFVLLFTSAASQQSYEFRTYAQGIAQVTLVNVVVDQTSGTAAVCPSFSATPAATPSATGTGTPASTPSNTVSRSWSSSNTATPTQTRTNSPTTTASVTSTASFTGTPSNSPTNTATASITATYTPSASITPTYTPSASITASGTGTVTVTASTSETASNTASNTGTPTQVSFFYFTAISTRG